MPIGFLTALMACSSLLSGTSIASRISSESEGSSESRSFSTGATSGTARSWRPSASRTTVSEPNGAPNRIPMTQIDSTAAVTVIRPTQGRLSINLREVWEHRELLYFFVWRDVKVRYKQTVIGAAWAVVQPLFTMIAFSLFFGYLARLPSEGLPYPLFYYSALLLWTYFANVLNNATNSVVEHQSMIKRVYFPRILLPLSAAISPLLDLAIAFLLLLGMLPYYGLRPTARILLVPLFLLLMIVTAIAVSAWLSALNAVYRDVRYAVPFLI